MISFNFICVQFSSYLHLILVKEFIKNNIYIYKTITIQDYVWYARIRSENRHLIHFLTYSYIWITQVMMKMKNKK